MLTIVSKAKMKTRSLSSQYETSEKITNKRASEYDISIAIPFSVVKMSKPKKKIAINGHALECG
jgi:hypothetical protein